MESINKSPQAFSLKTHQSTNALKNNNCQAQQARLYALPAIQLNLNK